MPRMAKNRVAMGVEGKKEEKEEDARRERGKRKGRQGNHHPPCSFLIRRVNQLHARYPAGRGRRWYEVVYKDAPECCAFRLHRQ